MPTWKIRELLINVTIHLTETVSIMIVDIL